MRSPPPSRKPVSGTHSEAVHSRVTDLNLLGPKVCLHLLACRLCFHFPHGPYLCLLREENLVSGLGIEERHCEAQDRHNQTRHIHHGLSKSSKLSPFVHVLFQQQQFVASSAHTIPAESVGALTSHSNLMLFHFCPSPSTEISPLHSFEHGISNRLIGSGPCKNFWSTSSLKQYKSI